MIDELIFLLEASGEQIRQYYKTIPEKEYYEILKADPTSIVKNNEVKKVGKYSKHCLDIYKKNPYEISQLEIALKEWEKNKKDIKVQFTKMKTITDILETAQNSKLEEIAKKESKIVVSDGQYILIHILSKNSAIYYGNYCGHGKKPNKFQSNWCTSYPEGSFYNNSYSTSKGDLYILMKKNHELISQFFISKNGKRIEAQDNNNEAIDIKDKYPIKVYNYLNKKYKLDKSNGYIFGGRTFEPIGETNEGWIMFDEIVLDHVQMKDLTELPWDNEPWVAYPLLEINDCGLTSLKNNNFRGCGLLDVSNNNITSLADFNGPDYSDGISSFHLANNKLKDFKGFVFNRFDEIYINIQKNNYRTFVGFPKLGSDQTCHIDASNNNILSLIGLPKKMPNSHLNISNNPKLKHLKYLPTHLKKLIIDKRWEGLVPFNAAETIIYK